MITHCPYCEKSLSGVNLVGLPGNGGVGLSWKCIAYSCPHCKKAISIAIDQIAIKSDIVNEIVAKLRR